MNPPEKTKTTTPAAKKTKVAAKPKAAKSTAAKPKTAKKTAQKTSSQAAVVSKLKKVDLFAGLSKNEIAGLSRLMTEISVPAGKVLVRQGAPGAEFMFIVSGKATVTRNKQKIATLTTGNFVGELSIVAKAPRYATVTADTDMVIKVLTPQEFMSMLDKSPKVAKKILIEAVTRLQQIENSKV